MNLTRREVHLKSTSEAHANGIERLWEFVVDELSLFGTHLDGSTKSLAEIHKFLDFSWEGEPTRPNLNIYVSPNIAAEKMNMLQEISAAQKFHQMTIPEAAEIVAQGGPLNSSIPLFDLAIVSSVSELDPLFRPKEDSRFGIVRPRGAILLTLDENPSKTSTALTPQTQTYTTPVSTSTSTATQPCANSKNSHSLLTALARGIHISSSRCGDQAHAVNMLAQSPSTCRILAESVVTHMEPLCNIQQAFELARLPEHIKVVVTP